MGKNRCFHQFFGDSSSCVHFNCTSLCQLHNLNMSNKIIEVKVIESIMFVASTDFLPQISVRKIWKTVCVGLFETLYSFLPFFMLFFFFRSCLFSLIVRNHLFTSVQSEVILNHCDYMQIYFRLCFFFLKQTLSADLFNFQTQLDALLKWVRVHKVCTFPLWTFVFNCSFILYEIQRESVYERYRAIYILSIWNCKIVKWIQHCRAFNFNHCFFNTW